MMNTTGKKRIRLIILSILLLIPLTALQAQTLPFEEYMNMGRMFESSGNVTMAERQYRLALDNYDRNSEQQLIAVELALVNLNKFRNPAAAQRLNDQIAQDVTKYVELRQKHIAMNACIAFCLNNKTSFEQANAEYIRLCQQNDTLPDTYDIMLQSMNEAMKGFYDDALKNINRAGVDNITKQDLRIRIYTLKGDMQAVIKEQQHKAEIIDSMTAANYDGNVNEKSLALGMQRAKQQTKDDKDRLCLIIYFLLAIIVLIVAVFIFFWRKQNTKDEKKNDQLMTALKIASESDEMKKNFVKRVSHEIRTPLNAITGFNDILNNPDIQLGQEERNELMTRINENVRAITVIADELLQAADAESTQDYAKYDTVMCNQFFADIIYNYNNKVSSKVQLKYSTKVINRFTIVTNADTVRKITEHLIANAIKFTEKGMIELACSESSGMLSVTVSDTGCGIPEDQQDAIFEQFTKADQFKQGIGLGLTVSRMMAQKLGGDLQLDKEYKDGARFVFTIPVK